jgi:2-polyprenyl-3-methyl-5-hydroxy-6-metoxy-1,4-benzoquinol methylase
MKRIAFMKTVKTGQPQEYVLPNSTAEDERLLAQGKIIDPLTRRVLVEAGLTPGMRVLDLGSGAGNVALLAAELVGPEGAVVGIEGDSGAAERAQRRARAAGVDNTEFRAGDVQTLEGAEGGFDAVTGRLILMHLPDPADALRRAAALARPGAVICMHELDLHYSWSYPQTPLWRQARTWFLDAFAQGGVRPRMGLDLFATFRAAGLPDPRLMLETFIGGGSLSPAWAWASAIGAVAPLMERLGIANLEEVGPETLAGRLETELGADGIAIGPPMIGAWSRVAQSSARSFESGISRA